MRALRWIYKKLASVKTSLIFIGLLIPYFFAGMLFPQDDLGRYYILKEVDLRWLSRPLEALHVPITENQLDAGFAKLVEFLQLLNAYSSWLFLSLILMLLVNLVVCTIERLRALAKQGRAEGALLTHDQLTRLPSSLTVDLPPDDAAVGEAAARFIRRLGFRTRKLSEEGTSVSGTAVKGMPLTFFSVVYHIGILTIVVGCFVTYLFKFDGEVVVFRDDPALVPMRSTDVRWNTKELWSGCRLFEETNPWRPVLHGKELKKDADGAEFILKSKKILLTDNLVRECCDRIDEYSKFVVQYLIQQTAENRFAFDNARDQGKLVRAELSNLAKAAAVGSGGVGAIEEAAKAVKSKASTLQAELSELDLDSEALSKLADSLVEAQKAAEETRTAPALKSDSPIDADRLKKRWKSIEKYLEGTENKSIRDLLNLGDQEEIIEALLEKDGNRAVVEKLLRDVERWEALKKRALKQKKAIDAVYEALNEIRLKLSIAREDKFKVELKDYVADYNQQTEIKSYPSKYEGVRFGQKPTWRDKLALAKKRYKSAWSSEDYKRDLILSKVKKIEGMTTEGLEAAKSAAAVIRATYKALGANEAALKKLGEAFGIADDIPQTIDDYAAAIEEYPELRYTLRDRGDYYSWGNVKEYRANVILHNNDGGVAERLVRVNYPAYHRGVYLYLSSPCCRVVFRAPGDQTVDATQFEEFEIPGVKGKFLIDYIVSGDLYKLNGEKERIKPFLKMRYTSPTGERKDYKKVFLGESIDLEGVAVTPERVVDGIVATYRHDPAAPMLWVGMVLVTAGMCLRIYGYSYRMRFACAQTADGGIRLSISVRGRGLLASEARVKRKCMTKGRSG